MKWETLFAWQMLVTVASLSLAIFTSAHVVLYKRDVRAAIGWVGLIWLTPLVGSFLYLIAGINRLQRKAQRLLAAASRQQHSLESFHATPEAISQSLTDTHSHLESLVIYGNRVLDTPLLQGNRFEPLFTGDEAYNAMLEAIANAQRTICLETYIFDNDRVGKKFVAALSQAKQRGVDVRILLDDVGIRYTWPSIRASLRVAGLTHATFLPTLIPWKFHYSNLRNHRKILVVDGKIGFTGGMNIREGHADSLQPKHPIVDLHFRVWGPVITQLQETFAHDWEFCTGETLSDDRWFPVPTSAGTALARGIADGPDIAHDKIRLSMMGALACARKSVTVVTPYFLPDNGLIHALNTADLRGVDVQIVIPGANNLALVQWASTAQLWQILTRGVQVWQTPPPFDHTKLMIVDDTWVLLGSANWDPRSLRLNFEFNIEAFDTTLAKQLSSWIAEKIARSEGITLAKVDGRSLFVRLRDGCARLLSPYL